ncbi:hypothetical protein Axy23_006 [Achromobacter phage vB_AxyP_19-32_Axy23]|uniref:Uncharacterized protein n=1 Tax=Achromobacter phage vB_AxyP_19-32_Axy23 TaxID=2591047 RepID=A0A514CW59_9CAUD|nr:hypothetical protein Axy23_006 [Achromobacter phage vB_AxyP_19-32_Axy23]
MKVRYIPQNLTPEQIQEREDADIQRLTALRKSKKGQATLRRLDMRQRKAANRINVEDAARASGIALTGSRGVRVLPKRPDPAEVHLIRELKAAHTLTLRDKLDSANHRPR